MRKFLFLLLTLCAGNSFSQVNLTSGLVAYYPFTGNANDASGNGNDGIANNLTLTTDHYGNPNKAYSFDGSSSFIRVPNSGSLALANQISLCAYVKVTGFYSGTCHSNILIDKGDNDGVLGLITLRFDDGQFSNGQQCSSSTVDQAHENFYGQGTFASPGYTPYITPNQWSFVVYTNDGTTAKLYIDGNLKSASSSSFTFNNSNDLFLGKANNPSFPYWFKGAMDEVRIYNRAINTNEILALMNYSPLPITISQFKTSVNSNKEVSINWVTNEQDINDYEVQRAGINDVFSTIIIKPSVGNGSQHEYSYIDKSLVAGGIYKYRLVANDKNGMKSFSEIKDVNVPGEKNVISIYPNPNSGQFVISFTSYKGNADVSINNLSGQTVYKESFIVQRDSNHQINMTNLNKGIYILRIKTSNGMTIEKITNQ